MMQPPTSGSVIAAPAVAHHFPALKSRTQPRLFLLRWDNSKTRTRDPRKGNKQEAYGTVYPNGLVTLDNGQMFTMMSELHHLLDLKGSYEIVYLDEMEEGQDGSQQQH
jgi:hypothetical protein